MQHVEARVWAPQRNRGVVYTSTGVLLGWTAGTVVRSTAAAVALTAAGRMLRSTAEGIAHTAEHGTLEEARANLRSLVGRESNDLDQSGIAAAVIESVAENSVDAVIAPAFWAVIGGARGATIYRAINTMDAMVGHRTYRYATFGWAAARLDDIANYVPARLFASLVVAQAPHRAEEIIATIRRDAPAHPSPNAGVAESSVAALLGVELGGPLRYGDRVENRPTLGTGPRPQPSDVAAAVALASRVELTTAALALAVAIAHELGGSRTSWT